MMQPTHAWIIAGLMLISSGCASTKSNSESELDTSTSSSTKTGKAATSSSSRTAPAPKTTAETSDASPQDEQRTSGASQFVVTALTGDGNSEGNIPESILSQTLMSLEELARKEPNNVPLNVTYMGLLRLYGRNPNLLSEVEQRAGAAGSKNAWYLIEASYAAMTRKEFSMAEFMLNKAQKASRDLPLARTTIQHATGVRLFLEGKEAQGMAEMKKAALSEPPFLPAVITIGFHALRTGDYKNAEKMFRSASRVNPNSMMNRLGLAAALRVQGKTDDAIPILAPLQKQFPDDRRILWNYCLTLSDGNEAQQKNAMDLLGRLFQLPSAGTPEIDAKATTLLTKLQNAQTKAAAAQSAAQAASKAAASSAAGATPAATTVPAGSAATKTETSSETGEQ
jgi:tetratricopeptide (TPR) repeat protein